MTSNNVLNVLTSIRIVPVIVIDDASHAHDLAVTLRDSGIPTAEVTLRTQAALSAMREMSSVDGFTVGAGTILSTSDAEAAAYSGARYLVSPGLDEQLVHHARARDVPLIPGVATASEVQRAYAAGLRHLKLFPAGTLGGMGLVDAFAGPFPHIRFLPSGGVTQANMTTYLGSPSVFAVSGSWMVPRTLISDGNFAAISHLAATAAAAASGA